MIRRAGLFCVLGAAVALAGAARLCAHEPGLIVSWGLNSSGQCNIPAPNEDFVKASCGLQHSLGLKADGTLLAWGYNGLGQCDVPEPGNGFIDMAGGSQHSLGLRADGSILAWGDNSSLQCNVPEPNSGFRALAAGASFSLALRSDSTLSVWGANDIGQLNIPAPNSGFMKITTGWYHSLAMRADGSLVGWGANQSHQTEVPQPNSGFVDMAAGLNHSLALRADGSIVAWGLNTSGQCNVPQPNSGYVAVAAGMIHSLAMRADGSIIAWGGNSFGQSEEPVFNSRFLDVDSYGWHNLAIQRPPACQVDVATLDFGVTPAGTPASRVVTVTNAGGGLLTGVLDVDCGAFQVVGDADYVLAAGMSQTFTLRLLSELPDDYACALHPGGACADVALTGTVEALPACSLDAAALYFGITLPDTPVTRELTITNTGGGLLTGEATEDCEAFSVTGSASWSLSAGQSQTLQLLFQSSALGFHTCELQLGACGELPLSGVVDLAPACALDAEALDFGLMPHGAYVTRQVTVTNTGGGLLTGVLHADCAAFQVVGDGDYVLAGGMSQAFTLRLQSNQAGSFACALHLGNACPDVALTGTVEPAPACALGATALNFGTVLPGTPVTRELTITNTGGGLLAGEVTEECEAFAVTDGASYSLGAGQSQVVALQFQSEALGAFSCALNVGSCGTVTLSGTTDYPPACALDATALDFGVVPHGTDVTRQLTVSNTGGGLLTGVLHVDCPAFQVVGDGDYILAGGMSQAFTLRMLGSVPGVHDCLLHVGSVCDPVTLTGTVEPAPACGLDAAALDFGSVLPGTVVTRDLMITNTGGGVLSGELTESCGAFAITSGATYSLGAGQSQTVTLQFQSDALGSFACALSAGVCGEVALSGAVDFAPACGLDATALDFGTVLPDSVVTRELTITNTGGGVLAGEVTEDCAAFTITSGAVYSLGAGQSQAVALLFQSASPGTFACALDVGTCGEVALSGTVDFAPACSLDATALDFGTVLPDSVVTRELTITNTGGGVLAGEVTEDCAAFTITSGAVYSLGAGQSQAVALLFQSASPGTFACALDVGSCGEVALGGVVELAPACALDAVTLDFGTVLPGTVVTRELTITNTGGGVLTGEVTEDCAAFAITSGAVYSLGAGQSQVVALQFQSATPGAFACALGVGSCGEVALGGASLSVTQAVGSASACGLVEDLGQQEGATSGFLVDWSTGLIGLDLAPTPGVNVTAAILVNGEVVWSGPALGAWRTSVYDLTPLIDEDITLHLALSDGQQGWNTAGETCLWDLRFAAAAASALPLAFQLHDAAPNPFNPVTRLRLDLPAADRVELCVLDLQGRLVSVLFSGDLPAGSHDFAWQPRGAASGTYFITVASARAHQVRKVLYLK